VIVVVVIIFVILLNKTAKITSENTLNVVAILSQTGPASFFGEELTNGMSLANETAKLNIKYSDSQSLPAVGASAFQQAIAVSKPDIAVVAVSSIAGAIMPIAIQNQIPVLQTLVSASKIAAQSPYTFRYFTSGEQESPIAAKIMLDVLKVKKVAVLYINDEYGLSYFNALKLALEPKGVTVISENFSRADTDFKTQLSKVGVQKPDAIYIVAYDKGLAGILKQVKELKISATMVANWVLASPTVRELTKGYDEGVYLTSPSYYIGSPTPIATEFAKVYKAKYQKDPTAYSAIGYDTVNLLAKIKKSEGDTAEDIIKKLTAVKSLKGVMGDLAMDADGEITFALYPSIVKDGKLVEVK